MPPFVGLSLRCDTALVTGRRYAVLTITERRDTPLRRSMARKHRKHKSGIEPPVLGQLAKLRKGHRRPPTSPGWSLLGLVLSVWLSTVHVVTQADSVELPEGVGVDQGAAHPLLVASERVDLECRFGDSQ